MQRKINGVNFTDEAIELWNFLSQHRQILFDTQALRALGEQRHLSSSQVGKYLRRMEEAGMIYKESYTRREDSSRWKIIIPIPKEIFTKGLLDGDARREVARDYAFSVCANELKRLRDQWAYEAKPLRKQKTVNGGVLTERAQRLYEILQSFATDGYLTAKNSELSAEIGDSEEKVSRALSNLAKAGMIYREIFQKRGEHEYPHRLIILIPKSIFSTRYESVDALMQAVNEYVHHERGDVIDKWHQEVGFVSGENTWAY